MRAVRFDGRLGILCAWVLTTLVEDVTLVGRHPENLEKARWRHLGTVFGGKGLRPGADVVVDATGSPGGITDAVRLVRPRGTVVLKTTLAAPVRFDLAPLVVNEITVVGSRCGRFGQATDLLRQYPDMPLERIISARFPLEKAVEAFRAAAAPGGLKVLLESV